MSEMNSKDAGEYVNEHYRKVAARWRARVTDAPFMQQLRAGTLPLEKLRTFFKNWGSYTIEINTVEAASYHKHIAFFRKHRDLMARMAEKLADELIHPKPPGHVHVVVETAKALGITEDEIFLAPMLAEFRAKLDFKRSLLWEGTMAEFYAAGATEEQTGYWSADFYKALTTHYGLSREQAVYFSTHEEADLKEHDGVMGHGSFRRLVLKTLLEDGMAQARPGYTLEYCGLTAVDLHGVCLNAALMPPALDRREWRSDPEPLIDPVGKVIGTPTPRLEGPEKVSGRAIYATDVVLPDMLWCKVLRSPLSYGRIKKIDVSRALALPGVHAVATGADVHGLLIGRKIYDMPILADGVVRFIGEKVAAVAAVSEAIAEAAVELIDVEYEELEPLLDPLAAVKPEADLLHPNVQGYRGLLHPIDRRATSSST